MKATPRSTCASLSPPFIAPSKTATSRNSAFPPRSLIDPSGSGLCAAGRSCDEENGAVEAGHARGPGIAPDRRAAHSPLVLPFAKGTLQSEMTEGLKGIVVTLMTRITINISPNISSGSVWNISKPQRRRLIAVAIFGAVGSWRCSDERRRGGQLPEQDPPEARRERRLRLP